MTRWASVGVVVIAGALGACRSTADTGAEGAVIDLETHDPEAMRVSGWLNPKTLQIHPATEQPEDGDMVVPGVIDGWRFTPTGDVEGALQEPPSRAKPDACWLVLADRTVIYREEGAEPPTGPHLEGLFDVESGLFYPASAVVHGR